MQVPETMCGPSLRGRDDKGPSGAQFTISHAADGGGDDDGGRCGSVHFYSVETFQRGVPRAPQCSAAGHA